MNRHQLRSIVFTLVAQICVLATNARADDDDVSYDVSTRIGGSLGTLQIEGTSNLPTVKTKTETYTLGGIPVSLALNFDIWERLSFAVGSGVLFDVPNRVILRQSIDFGTIYHILGGSRRLSRLGDAVSLVATSPWNLSLGVKMSLNNYSARIENVEFSGSAFETKVGLEYRKDVSPDTAFGSEIYGTVLAFPSSITRIRYLAVEVLGFWRLYL